MEKTFEIKGRIYCVESFIADENCYRLVYLPSYETSTNSHRAINLIEDAACEDYYGDIDHVTEIMAEQIREEAEKPYPWWTLLGAVYEWGSDPIDIEDEEHAKAFANVLDTSTIIAEIEMTDEEVARVHKEMLNLDGHDVKAIHLFVNGSYGTFSLADEWN